jgi:amino acid transporter
MTVPADTAPAGTFMRASSGLVRQVGTLDTLWYCVLQAALPYVFFMVAFWTFYPGASMELATLITIVGAASTGLVYALYASVYPRSGGEYVFLSRTVHPALGFASSFAMAFWQTFYFGINGAFVAIYAMQPLFAALGLQLGSQALTDLGAWFASPIGIFVTGAVVVLFFGVNLYLGMKAYFDIQRWAMFIGFASIGVTLAVLALGTTGALSFRQNLDQVLGAGTYQGVIDAARAGGATLGGGFSLGETIRFSIWPAWSLLFAVLSVSFSGEIRNVRRGQLVGIVGGIVLSGLILVGIQFFSRGAIGDEFLQASAFLFIESPEQLPLPSPWINLLASFVANSPIVTIAVNLWFVLLTAYVAAVTAVYASRAVFAWGIDGMAPEQLGKVSDRYHAPAPAIVLVVIGALGLLALYAFTDTLVILSGLPGMGIVFFVVSFAGIFFAYRYREAYEASAARLTVLGVPLMTVAGVIGSAFTAWVVWGALTDDTFGANSDLSKLMVLTVPIVGLVWFYVARRYQMSRGTDIDLRFKEIPIE